jgi:hypothetical protein
MKSDELTQVEVSKPRDCYFCLEEGTAKFDFKTRSGSWAYGCLNHYLMHRMYAELGTGKGQRLIVRRNETIDAARTNRPIDNQ